MSASTNPAKEYENLKSAVLDQKISHANQRKKSSNSGSHKISRSKTNLTLSKTPALVPKLFKALQPVSQPKPKQDGLSMLYLSDNFTIHLLLYYLDKSNQHGSTDILVNIMANKFKDESYFYIPQLCSILTKKSYCEPGENYLLDQCINSIKFSGFVYWIISSYSNYSKQNNNGNVHYKYDNFISTIEMTLVNGSRLNNNPWIFTAQTIDQLYIENINKQYRVNYFNMCIKFYCGIKSLCEKLKCCPKENKNNPSGERENVLRAHGITFNKMIHNMYDTEENLEKSNTNISGGYRGIVLPFDDSGSIANEDSYVIVNFLPEYCSCFNTKARVPVKLVFECIKVKDSENWNKLFFKDNNSSSTYESEMMLSISSPKENTSCEEVANLTNATTEYSSFDDFMCNFNSEVNIKEKEIKQIIDTINYDNEHGDEQPEKQKQKMRSPPFKKSSDDNTGAYGNNNIGNPFGDEWSEICNSIASQSNYSQFPSYQVKSFIAKANDDLRQEALTMQIGKSFKNIFKAAGIPLFIQTYEIIITSSKSGGIEYLPNTTSIDVLKKKLGKKVTFSNFFRHFFSENFEEAQKNFAESLAGYCLATYGLNIKDRHNGNILLDMNGNIIHIDFGFIGGISPGGNMNFENAPFKITKDYIEILNGENSNLFMYFKTGLIRGFIEGKHHFDSFKKIIDIMAMTSNMPCFLNRDADLVVKSFVDRFHGDHSDVDYEKLVNSGLQQSIGNWRTYQYDRFQWLTNDIEP